MNFFYKPKPGVIGDCIPYYYNGRYHIFFLHDHRDPDSYDTGSTRHHVSTQDFIQFEDHGVALPKASMQDHDQHPATGCVYTDDTGKHTIFYTGMNPYFRNDSQYSQVLLYATSDDLITWTKQPDAIWLPDESIYERHDWRDPFVFKHPGNGRFYMLVAARLKKGAISRRGCTALLTSDDLRNWQVEEPFYAPNRYHGHECPDWFQMGDWYYLIFSEYTTHTVTRYVMSRTPDGPWIAPDDNQFDNRAYYAAKSASDGSRRFLFGWNPTKEHNVDEGHWQWGGCLTVHEIIQNEDGTLSVRMPPETEDAFSYPTAVSLTLKDQSWNQNGQSYQAEAYYGYSDALSQPMPETYLLQGELTFEEEKGTAGVLLRMDGNADSGYFLRFNLQGQRLEFGKVGGYRNWFVDHMPELDRPLSIQAGQPLSFKIVVDKTAVVAYVNEQVALSGRMYSNPLGRCGLFVDGTAVSIHNFVSCPIAI